MAEPVRSDAPSPNLNCYFRGTPGMSGNYDSSPCVYVDAVLFSAMRCFEGTHGCLLAGEIAITANITRIAQHSTFSHARLDDER